MVTKSQNFGTKKREGLGEANDQNCSKRELRVVISICNLSYMNDKTTAMLTHSRRLRSETYSWIMINYL
jgi:hypothetical protein